MAAKAYDRGHPIIFKDGKWVYVDTLKVVNHRRECVRCGRKPTKEGFDACIGRLKNCSSACCGHGVEEPYRVEGGKRNE